MKINKYMDKWFGIFIIIILGLSYFFIIAETYALHPVTFKFYANDEMINVTRMTLQSQRDINFNDCLDRCYGVDSCDWNCADDCKIYYDITEGIKLPK